MTEGCAVPEGLIGLLSIGDASSSSELKTMTSGSACLGRCAATGAGGCAAPETASRSPTRTRGIGDAKAAGAKRQESCSSVVVGRIVTD